MTEQTFDHTSPDAQAAHAFLAELRLRIATQHLPFQHGDLKTALLSLVELFGIARDTVKAHPGCRMFADKVITSLNTDLRWMTAKWHRRSLTGELATRDGGVEFRKDLGLVQEAMQALQTDLYKMAYNTKLKAETSETSPGSPFNGKIPFGIPEDGDDLISTTDLHAINAAEAEEIKKRRERVNGQATGSKTVTDATGLAFSGGGIRSASFCLGVAQVLAEKGLLSKFDLMSSVSGGGYTASFLARRLVDGTETDLANPNGPDTGPIKYLRQNAAYLDTGRFSQTLPRAVGILAGMILNWTVPAAFVATLTCLVYALNSSVFTAATASWIWANSHWLALSSAALAMLGYAWMPRRWVWLRVKQLWVFGGLTAFFTFFTCIRWFYLGLNDANGWQWVSNVNYSTGATVAAVATALPILTRALPMLGKAAARRVGNHIVLAMAAVAIPFLGLMVAFSLYNFAKGEAPIQLPLLGWSVMPDMLLYAGTVFLMITAVWRVDINWSGPHWFYRESIAKTFIRLPNRASEADQSDRDNIALSALDPDGMAPYLLMNAVVNLPNSDRAELHERMGDFFVFSRHFCGSPTTGYAHTQKWISADNEIDLATAVATSGAAVAPQMALLNVSSARALLSFLNVRLGFWIRHPEKPRGLLGPNPGAVILAREMFAQSMSEKHAWIMLTDGAHLENSGVYELLRRRCRFIVAVDASADASGKFDTLLTLARHARIDLGVEIVSPLDELRPDPETGLSRAHGILCDVHYPGQEKAVMLYIKTAMTGNEDEIVQAYKRAHPAFPNQSTADQFFDEHQFEAYRFLGAHSAQSMLDEVLTGTTTDPKDVPTWLANLYARIPPEMSDDRLAK